MISKFRIFVQTTIRLATFYFFADLRRRKLGFLFVFIEPLVLFAIYYGLLYLLLGSRSEELLWHFIVGLFGFQLIRLLAEEVISTKEKTSGIMSVMHVSLVKAISIRTLVAFGKGFGQLCILFVILFFFDKLHLNATIIIAVPIMIGLGLGIGCVGLALRSFSEDLHYLINEGFRVLFFTSGVLFNAENLPEVIEPYATFHPILVAIETFRRGVTGTVSFNVDWTYLILITLSGLILGWIALALASRQIRNAT